jgi:protein-tyrosine phosphatase
MNFIPDDLATEPTGALIKERWRGRLAMCHAPGYFSEELEADIETIVRLRPALVVSLVTSTDLFLLPGAVEDGTSVVDRLRAAGLRVAHLPVPNFGVPTAEGPFPDTVRQAVDLLEKGETVVVHCLAGLGRTGTFAACCLVAAGVEVHEAIRLVRVARPHAVETAAQEGFVEAFEGEHVR